MAQTDPFVPGTAVRRANLPPTNYNLVALAPWVSGACSKKYMTSASTDPIRGFIFYRPNTSSAEPPPPSSPAWEINGLTKWRSQSAFPVFAVSGTVGQEMMRQLSLYSGNATAVPFGQNISDYYDPEPDDYIRIWTDISLSSPSTLFGIWVYFLIVAAVLFTIVSGTSLLMHLAQAGRRAGLRRRVVSGEVNLELMGIKRLTVPLSEIQKFPLYTYHYEPPTATSLPRPPADPRSHRKARSKRRSRASSGGHIDVEDVDKAGTATLPSSGMDYQPTCTICLGEFENRETVIREIRCGHIFHPECIDEFLGEISSLCPICKAKMLPPGYCPKISNEMVRRERAVRRLRHNNAEEDVESPQRESKRRSPISMMRSGSLAASTDRAQISIVQQAREKDTPGSSTQARARMHELAGPTSDEDDNDVGDDNDDNNERRAGHLAKCMFLQLLEEPMLIMSQGDGYGSRCSLDSNFPTVLLAAVFYAGLLTGWAGAGVYARVI